MDELLFREIPEDGFEPEHENDDRLSNATPSRKNAGAAGRSADPDDLVSSPTPTRLRHRRSGGGTAEAEAEDTSLASNPTPTRRSAESYAYLIPKAEYFGFESEDPLSRQSNTTPTRRDRGLAAPFAAAAEKKPTGQPENEGSRASSPTPSRRRTGSNK